MEQQQQSLPFSARVLMIKDFKESFREATGLNIDVRVTKPRKKIPSRSPLEGLHEIFRNLYRNEEAVEQLNHQTRSGRPAELRSLFVAVALKSGFSHALIADHIGRKASTISTYLKSIERKKESNPMFIFQYQAIMNRIEHEGTL